MSLKNKLSAVGISLALVGGGGAVATATALPASAATIGSCYRVFGTSDEMCYVDYNWWEESWMGGSNRDHWERYYGAYNTVYRG